MSNRGRQNVASYLVLDLGVDWRRGADYFENVLLDYDVSPKHQYVIISCQGRRISRLILFNIPCLPSSVVTTRDSCNHCRIASNTY